MVLLVVHNRDVSPSSKGRISADSGHRLVMGTFARVVAVAADTQTAEKSIEAAFEQLTIVDKLMSDYKADSEISKVNRDAFWNPVVVSESTFGVLQRSIELSELSDGAFDITIGPLVDLWRKAADANTVPTDDQLTKTRAKVGYEKLILDSDERSVRFAVDGMRLDLGGIAKGYVLSCCHFSLNVYSCHFPRLKLPVFLSHLFA